MAIKFVCLVFRLNATFESQAQSVVICLFAGVMHSCLLEAAYHQTVSRYTDDSVEDKPSLNPLFLLLWVFSKKKPQLLLAFLESAGKIPLILYFHGPWGLWVLKTKIYLIILEISAFKYIQKYYCIVSKTLWSPVKYYTFSVLIINRWYKSYCRLSIMSSEC